MGFVVGIDGPAGSGKGTITKKVANSLGLTNIDTGSTYRCVALETINRGISIDNKEEIIKVANQINIEIETKPEGDIIYLNGKNVTKEIRSKDVTKIVSQISSIVEVRLRMVDVQRKLAEGKNVIMEGRDICTYVFPNADVKIYLDASLEERAKRRYKENQEKNIDMTYEEILDNISKRDYNDMHKEIGSLTKTPESVVIDTTNLSIDEVVQKVIDVIKQKRNEETKCE